MDCSYEARQRALAQLERKCWRESDQTCRIYFRPGLKSRLHANDLAFHALARRAKFYKALLEGQTAFEEACRQWLGKESCGEDPVSKLVAFCEEHDGQILSTETFEALRPLAVEAAASRGFREPHPARIAMKPPSAMHHPPGVRKYGHNEKETCVNSNFFL